MRTKRHPHGGDLYIFRVRRGDLAKILWNEGIGLSLHASSGSPRRRHQSAIARAWIALGPLLKFASYAGFSVTA
jgi:hypothetical protein